MAAEKPISINFAEPTNLEELAKYIGISADLLKYRIEHQREEAFFIRHEIPKRNAKFLGEYRVVWEPESFLAQAYKSFSRRFDLFSRYIEPRYPHSCAFGYVRGRGTLDNASGHCQASRILHADIDNFFPSISRDRLKTLFKEFGLQEGVIDILSRFVTIQGSLPLGLHSSPLLANLVCLNLDDKLQKLAQSYQCVYTRYADDITISGKLELPDKEEIKSLLQEEGFALSERKFGITKLGQAHYVTGLSVSDAKPHAPRHMKKKLRQELYYCEKFGIEEHVERVTELKEDNYIQRGINRIDGMVRYISHIEQKSLPYVRKNWEAMCKEQGVHTSYETIFTRKARFFNFYIDEAEIEYNNRKFLVLCLVQIHVQDFQNINATTLKTHRNHIADPFAGGNKQALLKKGLHYSDANEDLRRDYIGELSTFPYKAYLIYGEMAAPDDYEELYINLIKKILPHRLMACDYSTVELIFEENSKVKKSKLQKAIENIYASLKAAKNRHPVSLKVETGTKAKHPCFSIPDFLLGVFSKYAVLKAAKEKGDRQELFFEKLRDKYRVIVDADSNMIFSRKRSFVPWD